MNGLNRVQLLGNVGQAPEIRSTTAGGRIANFSLATNESWKDKVSGEKKERVEWHRIVVFNEGLVGIIEQYVRKGSKLFVEGQLRTRKWADNAGVDHYSVEIVLAAFNGQIILLDGAGNRPPPASAEDYGGGPGYASGPQGPAPARARRDDLDDEIPF